MLLRATIQSITLRVMCAGACAGAVVTAADGVVVGWGALVDPVDGVSATNYAAIAAIPTDLGDVVDIAVGERFALALRSDGTVRAWGDNSSGACDVPVGLTDVVSIHAGERHALALRSNGQVVTWGTWVNFHEDSTFTVESAIVPAGVPPLMTIDANRRQSGGLDADGRVWLWGWGDQRLPATPTSGWRSLSVSAGEIITTTYVGAAIAVGRQQDGTPGMWGVATDIDYSVPAGLPAALDVRFSSQGWVAAVAQATGIITAVWGSTDDGSSAALGRGPYVQFPATGYYGMAARKPDLTAEVFSGGIPGVTWSYPPPAGLVAVRTVASVFDGHLALSRSEAPPARVVWLHAPTEAVTGGTVLGHVLVTGDLGNSSGLALVAGAGDANNADVVLDGHIIRAKQDLVGSMSRTIRLASTETPVACADTAVEQVWEYNAHGPIQCTPAIIAYNASIGAEIGAIVIDGHVWNTGNPYATFATVSGAGDQDNALVSINQDRLVLSQAIVMPKTQLSIRVRTTFAVGDTRDDVLLIQVTQPAPAPSAGGGGGSSGCGMGGLTALLFSFGWLLYIRLRLIQDTRRD